MIDTGLSQILLGVVSADKKDRGLTRHEKTMLIVWMMLIMWMMLMMMTAG